MGSQAEKTETINRNLITLKIVVFLFYGGLACVYSSLTTHMIELSLNFKESRIILIVVPIISLLGPLIFGPLADRIAAKKPNQYGKYLRIIIAVLMLLAALVYSLLLVVPDLHRSAGTLPLVSFGCDSDGAIIFQERCSDERTCYHWSTEKMGNLKLSNCSYTCQNPKQYENLYVPWAKTSATPPVVPEFSRELADDLDYLDSESEDLSFERQRRELKPVMVEPPHLCTKTVNADGVEVLDECHVYTKDSKTITVAATLHSATNQENETHSAEWCNYPLDGFSCNIPEKQAIWMTKYMNSTYCKPMIECTVVDPYHSPESVLSESQCIKIVGDVETTFWSYFIIRCIADIFPAAIVTLLNTACIVATRETSTGRGDVGRQLAWGSFGWAIFPLILGLSGVHADLLIPLIIFDILMIIGAVILLLGKNMPLSPAEWWWHTKSGMLAIPMSAIRKYGPEIAALTLVTIALGVFWSVIDSYLPWLVKGLDPEEGKAIIKYVLTVAALPAILLLWNAERLVDYAGHSNILIGSFTVYILRYTGLAILDNVYWILFIAAMEPITLGLTWVTIVLYMRHLVPRRITASGQALPVIAFFCIGKSIGAMLGLIGTEHIHELRCLYTGMAITACVIAVIYFVLYHCLLAPRCAAKTHPPPPPSVLNSNVTNGNTLGANNGNNSNNYTPLRVYHNGRGRKGQFRY